MASLLHFDPGAGASGDMVLGALIDVGVPVEVIEKAVRKAGVPVRLDVKDDERHGVRGIKARFVSESGEPVDPIETGGEVPPIIVRASGSGSTSVLRRHVDLKSGNAHADHAHHLWKDIEKRLMHSGLSTDVRDLAHAILRRLAIAEATVHGLPLDEVAFHEVAAADSLGDMVGAAAAICHLAPARITCDAFGICGGAIRMEHGVLPSPGPATGVLLVGAPIVGLSGRMESVTPTGAAILTTVAHAFGPPPAMTLRAQGHGLGLKDPPERANLLRAWLGETGRKGARVPPADAVLIETNLDDATPQALSDALQACLEAGALDAWITPVVMKKGRPGFTLHALVEHGLEKDVVAILLTQTSTLGVRRFAVERTVAPRRIEHVDTSYGRVRVKVAGLGRDIHAWPEHDDCVRLAARDGVGPDMVQGAALAAWHAGRSSKAQGHKKSRRTQRRSGRT